MNLQGKNLKRFIFPSILGLFLIAVGYSTIYRAAWSDIQRTDFTVYSIAGQAILDDVNIYQIQNSRNWNYVYPPPFAILMIPFALIPIAWGAGIWYVISVLMIGSVIYMSAKLVQNNLKPEDKIIYQLPAFLISPWLLSGIMRCQASEWMIWLMIAAVFCHLRGRPALAGASIAAASLMKAFPIALMAYFVWRKDWRLIAAFSLTMFIGGFILPASVFGFQKNLDYWQQWGGLVAGPALAADNARLENPLYGQLLDAQKPRNQSIESILLTIKVKPELSKPILAGIAFLMLISMLVLYRPDNALLIASSFITWNLMIPPISESHYFGLLLLPLALLTGYARNKTDFFTQKLSFAMLILFTVLAAWSALYKPIQLYRLLGWATLGVWLTLMLIAYHKNKTSPEKT